MPWNGKQKSKDKGKCDDKGQHGPVVAFEFETTTSGLLNDGILHQQVSHIFTQKRTVNARNRFLFISCDETCRVYCKKMSDNIRTKICLICRETGAELPIAISPHKLSSLSVKGQTTLELLERSRQRTDGHRCRWSHLMVSLSDQWLFDSRACDLVTSEILSAVNYLRL